MFASHADSKICGRTKMFQWQMIILVWSWSILFFCEKESGVCRLECFIVFEGMLFELGKNSPDSKQNILGLRTSRHACMLEYLRILSYPPRMPIRIRPNLVANMCLFAQWGLLIPLSNFYWGLDYFIFQVSIYSPSIIINIIIRCFTFSVPTWTIINFKSFLFSLFFVVVVFILICVQ